MLGGSREIDKHGEYTDDAHRHHRIRARLRFRLKQWAGSELDADVCLQSDPFDGAMWRLKAMCARKVSDCPLFSSVSRSLAESVNGWRPIRTVAPSLVCWCLQLEGDHASRTILLHGMVKLPHDALLLKVSDALENRRRSLSQTILIPGPAQPSPGQPRPAQNNPWLPYRILLNNNMVVEGAAT